MKITNIKFKYGSHGTAGTLSRMSKKTCKLLNVANFLVKTARHDKAGKQIESLVKSTSVDAFLIL